MSCQSFPLRRSLRRTQPPIRYSPTPAPRSSKSSTKSTSRQRLEADLEHAKKIAALNDQAITQRINDQRRIADLQRDLTHQTLDDVEVQSASSVTSPAPSILSEHVQSWLRDTSPTVVPSETLQPTDADQPVTSPHQLNQPPVNSSPLPTVNPHRPWCSDTAVPPSLPQVTQTAPAPDRDRNVSAQPPPTARLNITADYPASASDDQPATQPQALEPLFNKLSMSISSDLQQSSQPSSSTFSVTPSTSPIDILIGNDYYMDLILPQRQQPAPGLYLLASRLGWIVSGRIPYEPWPPPCSPQARRSTRAAANRANANLADDSLH